jgi:hypothetical protein
VIIFELISVVGGHWHFWRRGTKIVFTPLNTAVSFVKVLVRVVSGRVLVVASSDDDDVSAD